MKFLFLLLFSVSATAETLTIGSTDFPLGEDAFPKTSTCLSTNGCSGTDNVVVDFRDPLMPQVTAANTLRGHRLDLVALDLNGSTEIQLGFPAPIVNQTGTDLYLGQALFLGDLSDAQGINDIEISFNGTVWQKIVLSRFEKDDSEPSTFVSYSDPEIKQDAYDLWVSRQDLSDFGLAQDEAIDQLFIRGTTNQGQSGLDLAVIGNLNMTPVPLPGSALLGLIAFGKRRSESMAL